MGEIKSFLIDVKLLEKMWFRWIPTFIVMVIPCKLILFWAKWWYIILVISSCRRKLCEKELNHFSIYLKQILMQCKQPPSLPFLRVLSQKKWHFFSVYSQLKWSLQTVHSYTESDSLWVLFPYTKCNCVPDYYIVLLRHS